MTVQAAQPPPPYSSVVRHTVYNYDSTKQSSTTQKPVPNALSAKSPITNQQTPVLKRSLAQAEAQFRYLSCSYETNAASIRLLLSAQSQIDMGLGNVKKALQDKLAAIHDQLELPELDLSTVNTLILHVVQWKTYWIDGKQGFQSKLRTKAERAAVIRQKEYLGRQILSRKSSLVHHVASLLGEDGSSSIAVVKHDRLAESTDIYQHLTRA